MRSGARSVDAYLQELPEDRRAAVEQVRHVILENLPDGIEEAMNWGMIAYEVPLSVYPDTYNGRPLMYAALASQKNHMALYLTSIYMDDEERDTFEREYRETGKRFDVGKSCVRFRRIEDLPLDVVGRAIGSITANDFVARVRVARGG